MALEREHLPSRYAPPPPLHPSPPPRGIGECGFWSWWVAVKIRRGALRAPAVTLNVGRGFTPAGCRERLLHLWKVTKTPS